MIIVELFGKSRDVVAVDPHPEYIDFTWRDARAQIAEGRVEISAENFAAPIVASIDGMTAIETYTIFDQAIRELATDYEEREDGARILALLMGWSRRWPEARWHVAGGDDVDRNARFVHVAKQPRFSSRTLSIDPFAPGIRFLGEADRMDDLEGTDIESIIDAASDDADIFGPRLLQREVKIQITGSSNGAKFKKDDKSGKLSTQALFERLSTSSIARATAVVSTRVPEEVKVAIDADPAGKRLVMEALGAALLSGRSYADVLSALNAS